MLIQFICILFLFGLYSGSWNGKIWPHFKEELNQACLFKKPPPFNPSPTAPSPFSDCFFSLVQTICPVFLSVDLLFLSPKINCTHIWVHAWHTRRNGRGRGRRNNQDMKTKEGGGWRLVGWGPGSGVCGGWEPVVMWTASVKACINKHPLPVSCYFLEILSLVHFNRCFCKMAAVVLLSYATRPFYGLIRSMRLFSPHCCVALGHRPGGPVRWLTLLRAGSDFFFFMSVTTMII